MNVADEDGAFFAELGEAQRKILEERFRFGGVSDLVCADIDDGGARFEPVGLHVAGFAHGGDDDVRAANDVGKIAGFGMADGDGGICVHQKKRHRLADDIAAAEDDGVGSFDGYIVAAKNFHAAGGSAGDETFASADESSEIDGMKTVDVFCGVDGFENFFCVDLFGEGKLDEDAVDVVVAVEIVDEFQHVFGGGGGQRRVQPTGEAELFASGDFAFDVELGGWIFSDEDGSEAGTDALGVKACNFVLQFEEDLVADFESIKDACGHAGLTFD